MLLGFKQWQWRRQKCRRVEKNGLYFIFEWFVQYDRRSKTYTQSKDVTPAVNSRRKYKKLISRSCSFTVFKMLRLTELGHFSITTGAPRHRQRTQLLNMIDVPVCVGAWEIRVYYKLCVIRSFLFLLFPITQPCGLPQFDYAHTFRFIDGFWTCVERVSYTVTI